MGEATGTARACVREAQKTEGKYPNPHDQGSGFCDRLVGVADVMDVLGVSEASAYRVIRTLNAELVCEGRLTFEGRVSRNYLTMRYLVTPSA